MADDAFSPQQMVAITEYVDIEAPLIGPSAHFIFGTNQTISVDLVIDRYHAGIAPFIIATGGVNRHTGVIEGQEFRRRLIEGGVSESAIRCEYQSKNTWENVEFALPYLREAIVSGLAVTAVSKWYHRRTVHCLGTLLPELEAIYAATFEPIYSSVPVTRENWISHPDGKRRVIREWEEVRRRVSEGSYKELNRISGAWR